jgi:RNA polymerase sigma-70 factor (ECF subfamily)
VSLRSSLIHAAGPADPLDNEAALEACARGDRFALRALYEREARPLLGVALRIVRNRELAHDVLQDAFLQVWQRASTYQRALGSARGWLYTVVRHRALDELRRSGRETPVGDDLEAIADARQAADRAMPDPPADSAALERCLGQLDERRRDCILRAFVEGWTHEQIASHTSTPVGTVKSWIRRSLIALKECLQ